MIAATIFAGTPSMFIGLHWVNKRYGTKANFGASARIFLAAAIAGLTTYLITNALAGPNWILLLTGVSVFLVVYLITAPLLGAVNQIDIDNLRAMFSSIGRLSMVLEIPLTVMEKTSKIRHSLNRHPEPAT